MDLEQIAHRLSNFIFKNAGIDPVTKAKAEYGLALLLGILIELAVTLTIAGLLGLFQEAFILMTVSLLCRIFTGGVHCSSYLRCLVFTVCFYLVFALAAKHLFLLLAVPGYLEKGPAQYLFLIGLGFLLQIMMAAPRGDKIVNIFEKIMKRAGI